MNKINDLGFSLLKHFEGCKLEAYQDIGGVWTIGYGHTGPEVVKGMVMTQEQADATLIKDLETKAYPALEYIEYSLSDNETSALYCLVYNIGLDAFRTSTLRRCINSRATVDAAWLMWSYVHGVQSRGLMLRREDELELWHKA